MPAISDTSGRKEHGVPTNGVMKPTALGTVAQPELDDFGLPVKKLMSLPFGEDSAHRESISSKATASIPPSDGFGRPGTAYGSKEDVAKPPLETSRTASEGTQSGDDEFIDAISTPPPEVQEAQQPATKDASKSLADLPASNKHDTKSPKTEDLTVQRLEEPVKPGEAKLELPLAEIKDVIEDQAETVPLSGQRRGQISATKGISEWSHQQLAPKPAPEEDVGEDEWQTMPAFAPFDMYDDDNKLIAREARESDDEAAIYGRLGGAGHGYTRVQLDEDAQSATSMDDNTQYLFKEINGTSAAGLEDDEQRDAVSQMQATKGLLTEGQRIAYVGVTRLALSDMLKQAEALESRTKGSKKEAALASEAMKMWAQKMMVRLYAHMDISTAEQIMIEQLDAHGVQPKDLTPTLMQNSRVKNPMANKDSPTSSLASPRPGSVTSGENGTRGSVSSLNLQEEEVASAPPPYTEHEGDGPLEVRSPSQLPTSENIDIDLRWTVLCDLFLTLVADTIYDARSRVLLENVAEHMDVPWTEICRFEKRVTDALEMQQAAEKENWNEDEHKENRRKMALKKRYMIMGLATVGGSLVIGLSAGLLAPVIGAGLAAGFTTIGVAGTGGFLAGVGGTAIIASTGVASGGIIAVKAANRRTGSVKTFEYRPLHNNKRVNLIITVSGWMTGKIDDVRLPYSTVDPIMGDIYSVLWEPEMLTSMGDTINILATEALTQGLQQVLGSTILVGLMAAIQLPIILTKLSYLIDNPWTVSLDRANAAGLILADSLIDRNLGTRPITLVGYSLGSRLIFSCLRELAKKGAFGLVQNVYMFGSPIVANKDEYLKARTVVAGRFVNGYARNDWILGYLFRLTSGGISRVAGLAPVEDIPRLENVDVTDLVPGHMSYRAAMPRLLREVGWLVESDEFSEIEDPDPENHQKHQRELIDEIEEARRELEKQEKGKESKGKFGFFSRKKKTKKEEWETYRKSSGDCDEKGDDGHGSNNGVLFDIDAIRAELAGEFIEVKELESTLPPMRLDLESPKGVAILPRSVLRETKSYDPSITFNSKTHITPSFSSTQDLPRTSISQESNVSGPDRSSSYHYQDDEIQMSFDTSHNSHALPSTSFTKSTLPALPPAPPMAEPADRAATLQRPELKSSNTLPVMGMGLDHNAWADEDEEFREEEMEMTFA